MGTNFFAKKIKVFENVVGFEVLGGCRGMWILPLCGGSLR
jgi:hypothetical protein